MLEEFALIDVILDARYLILATRSSQLVNLIQFFKFEQCGF